MNFEYALGVRVFTRAKYKMQLNSYEHMQAIAVGRRRLCRRRRRRRRQWQNACALYIHFILAGKRNHLMEMCVARLPYVFRE